MIRWVDDWTDPVGKSTVLVKNDMVDVVSAQLRAVGIGHTCLGPCQTPSNIGWSYMTLEPGWRLVLPNWNDVVDDEEFMGEKKERRR